MAFNRTVSNATIPVLGAALGALAFALTGCGGGGGDAPQTVTVTAPPGNAQATAEQTPPPPRVGAAPTPAGVAPIVDPRAELEVSDQDGDGRSVQVRFARISSGAGYVAVFDRNRTLLGSAPLAPSGGAVTVTLNPSVANGELIATLYGDDGDGRFDPAADPQIVDDENEPETEDFDYRVR